MTNVQPLPAEIADITPAWLSAAPGCTVSAARVVDVNNGTCTKIRFALEADDPVMTSRKTAPQEAGRRRDLLCRRQWRHRQKHARREAIPCLPGPEFSPAWCSRQRS
ncbi:hypothetical protein [Novosphingobium mangrovi (ex Huang et al. 2023)]|uniref:Uncharacterized protein n=1 Tax=Novosphingobium mangrovi (ex Huang et al. 2023) TaxID=2976432 RepID=A0ABT2I078_9SPHN|nr:hypothetical protein [Novosphingobium mangrovi (ex Huang et al. 2023)]MCT2398204.1 hypothetical protein [Novosphingobium mangrovi (ex Huang et al. 2023)]